MSPRYRTAPKRTGSLAPDIIEFGKANGIELDDWQQDVIEAFSGTRASGKRWSSPSNYLLVARQNGKSMIFVLRALFGLFALRKRMILYSSHQWASSNEAFLAFKAIIESNPALSEQVKHFRHSVALLGCELHDGGRILFLTRSRAAARGFSGDELYFDEAHFLSEAAHAALRPTLGGRSAEGSIQVLYASSAVDSQRHPDGVVVARLRQRGIAGDEGLAFVEYSAGVLDDAGDELHPALVPAAVLLDPEVLKRANPACPHRVSLEFLQEEARTLDPASHAVEHLSQGDWPDLNGAASGVLDLDKWAALVDGASRPVPPVTIAFDVSPDRRRSSIAIGGMRLDGDLHAELSDSSDGVGWLLPRLKQLIEDHDPLEIVCDASQAIIAEQVWSDVGVRVKQLDRAELSQACGYFVDAVEEGRLRHLGDPVLVDALRGATTSNYGGDGWVFSRRSSSVDISPLYSVVMAITAAGTSGLPTEPQIF